MNQRNVLFGLGVVAWSILVFFVTFYLTFPSSALVARIEKEAPSALGRGYDVSLASAAPWWVGVSMTDVKVTQKPTRRVRTEEAEDTVVAFIPKAWVRTSLFSLIRQSPSATGALRLGDGRVDFDISTRASDGGALDVSAVDIEADELPLADLVASPFVASALGGFTMVSTGELDLDVDLQAGEQGMADGSGRFALTGADLMLAEIASDTTGPLGIDVPINKIDLVAEIDEGKGEVDKGLIDSDLFRLEIKGDFGLRDPLSSSTINLELELSDISKDLSLVETMLRSALGATAKNGAYTFTCRGMVSRLNSRSCRADAGRRASNPRGNIRTPPKRAARPRPSVTRRGGADIDDERKRRREEIRERLRARQAGREPDDVEEPLDDLEDVVDEYEDEDVIDEDLDYEDEDFVE